MRFTPVFFAGLAAASYGYGAETTTSSTKAATTSATWADPGYGAGYWPETTSSSTSSKAKALKTTTVYETECWTVTTSSSTKVWTSVKAIPTVCEDDDEWDPSWSASGSWSTPAAPVVTATHSSVPYCEAVTETCTVTVTATGAGSWPVSSTKAAPVVVSTGSWPAGAASGTGSWSSPYAAQFTGAASAQKAGAFLAGAGAVAALLL